MTRLLRRDEVRTGTTPRGRGFTLLELAVVLVIFGLIAIASAALVPKVTDGKRLGAATVALSDAGKSLTGFALEKNRLPCPDVNGDGLEGTGGTCGAADEVGEIPYKSLGLPGPVLDETLLPLRYGVYRKATADADLVTLTNLYEPPLPAALVITPNTVQACGEILDDAIQIVYENATENLLTVVPTVGTFDVDDIVTGSTLDYDMKVPGTLPPPPACPGTCVLVDPPPIANPTPPPPTIDPPPFCDCNDFLVDEVVYLSGEAPGEPPSGTIDALTSTTLFLRTAAVDQEVPADTFTVGDTVVGSVSGVTAKVTGFFFPGTARVRSVVTPGQVYEVELTPETTTFLPSQILYDGQGNKATFFSLVLNSQTMFQLGETITGQTSGATGTVDFDDGKTMTVSNVSGAFIGPPTSPTVDTMDPSGTSGSGEVILGGTSGADGNILSITLDALADPIFGPPDPPGPGPGIQFVSDPMDGLDPMFNVTESNQLNGLDMCKNVRNGILEADEATKVHTLNSSSVLINPAFLVASGGVKDADGDGADLTFDGLNEGINPLDFNSPALGRSASYDDLVRSTSMQSLDQRFSCARNLGAVNGAALDARAAQNLAITAFNNHANAICTIIATLADVKLAKAFVLIEYFNLLHGAAECARAVADAFSTNGGNAVAAAAACGAAILQAVNFAFAVDAENKATDLYNDACTDELVAGTELNRAELAATAALQRAIEADQKGGVQ